MKHTPLIVCASILLAAMALSAWTELHPVQTLPPAPNVAPTPAPAPLVIVPGPPTPAPSPHPCPHPCPGPGPCPHPRQPCPRDVAPGGAGVGTSIGAQVGTDVGTVVIDGPEHAGQTVQCDLPVSQRLANIGSHVDKAGMCVMSSIEMAARYAGLEQMRGLRDWCAKEPGGAGPRKVERQIAAYCAAKGIPVPPYVQYEGPADMAALRAVLAGNRMAAVTYGGEDGVRYRDYIAHMVTCVAAHDSAVALLDNNKVGDRELLWMSESDFAQRWGSGFADPCWLFAWVAPGAPPAPK